MKKKEDFSPEPPQTDEQIEAVMVGDKRIINSTIELVPYDPQWPERFEVLKKQICQVPGRCRYTVNGASEQGGKGIVSIPSALGRQ